MYPGIPVEVNVVYQLPLGHASDVRRLGVATGNGLDISSLGINSYEYTQHVPVKDTGGSRDTHGTDTRTGKLFTTHQHAQTKLKA